MNWRTVKNSAGLRTAVCLTVFFALLSCFPSWAADQGKRIIRVPFAEVKGLEEKDSNGEYKGLVIDYLNEIAKYTGWEYEYVEMTGEEMVEAFDTGGYELMGGNYYLPGMEEFYWYPDYNIGFSKAVLLARRDDDRIRSYDLRTLNGKTIGVYDRAVENVRRLKVFLDSNGLDCTLKYYSYEELGPDAKLYQYLESGEVDLLLGNSAEPDGSYRVAVSYDSQPHYIVTNVGNQEVLDGLNMALGKIADSNPNFAAQRYAANFLNSLSVDIRLNESETDYIREKGTVTVAIPKNYHPMVCPDPDDLHEGLVYDILKEISAFTGLEFSFVYADSYHDAVRAVQQGEADILGFFLGSEADSVQKDLVLTAPFVSMNCIIVRNKAVGFPDSGLKGAVIEGREMPADIQTEEVHSYRSTKEELGAVNRGTVDFAYGLSAHLEREIQRGYFANVVPVALVNDRADICFALPRPADPMLLTILNKAVNCISEDQKSKLLNQNIVSTGNGRLSLPELIYANPITFIVSLSALLLLLVTAVLGINRMRTRAAIMQNNLERAEAENRAKGEFLSRMSHELRTPMNAVVGLADLVSRTQGVPDSARENLSKLRASSNYLLELINDILDMSRLDSGMLSISLASFSMEHMLYEIQSMMEEEARRRGLDYRLEKEIVHDGVSGDVLRLRQVIINLISNAMKFTPEGGIVILRVTEDVLNEEKSSFLFQVIDSGVGIRQEDQERIFKSFEQVGTNYARTQGTGLGLAISRNIVELMGGELKVKSEYGQGSEFYFSVTLPFAEDVEEAAEVQELSAEDHALKGISILLAEDNDLNAEIAANLLELQGAAVSRAENGKLAVKQFAESKPGEFRIILMDIQMPEMNGLDAARAIRALDRPDASDIPIVAMTANTFREDVDAAMAAGMNGFAGKPLNVEYLYNLLRGLLK